jgi:site-specific DNA-methyltransferase (adenine-specific)
MTDIKLENAHIMFGDAMKRLKELPDNSVDSIVTDPPYGLSDNKFVADTIIKWVNGERDFIPDGKGFMGKAWDSFVPPPAIWDECLRVLKPGGHLLAFFGSRTQDIGALSIRLAGFEIRDSIAWVYGSGFPKSLDISKAIDKQAGAKRKVIGKSKYHSNQHSFADSDKYSGTDFKADITAPSTAAAKQYSGWGTALKPAVEPIVVARKPLGESTVANNVLKWGTGGLNIDASRIGTELIPAQKSGKTSRAYQSQETTTAGGMSGGSIGRFPANIILDEEAAVLLDEQADASRFFYVAKASKVDRNEGLDELEDTFYAYGNQATAELKKGNTEFKSESSGKVQASKNFHPTVKPTKLMEYLIKLVTPVGGTVLDPFTGSGSTGKAALLNGFKFVGCELTKEYLPIIEGRLKFAEGEYQLKLNNNPLDI